MRGGTRPAARRAIFSERAKSGNRAPDSVNLVARAGDLKGKKIGTQWRVTRAAVDAFMKS